MEWFENEGFWREGYRFMFSDEAFEAARTQTDQLTALTGVDRGRVLDLGCGPGRHAVPLATRGFQVTGVDASPFLLAKALERSEGAGVDVEWVRDDMRSFCRPDAFDLALSLYSSFGYFEDRADDRRVALNLHDSLRPGGVLVMDLMSKELTSRFRESRVTEAEGVTRVEQHQIVENWTRIRSEWLLIHESSVQKFEYCVRIYSGQELEDLLRLVGFETVALYGDMDGRPYGPGATRLVAVARKA